MSHYTMLYKYGKHRHYFLRRFYSYLSLVFFIFLGGGEGVFYSTPACWIRDDYNQLGFLPLVGIYHARPMRACEIIVKYKGNKNYGKLTNQVWIRGLEPNRNAFLTILH